jgi:2-oxoisovalerate dehydrogenase E1 component alpha subunit
MIEKRHEKLGLSSQTVREMYYIMLLARKLDERMWLLNRAGKINFTVSGQGHEAAQVGAAFALDPNRDYLFPYYRDMAMVLTFGMTAREIMLSAFAKAEDPNSGGRQMPGHFSSRKRRIVTGSSPVTTQVPQAAGLTLAAKMDGKNLVALVSFGEGSSNQGDFHEGLNFAGVHKLPVIFFCENNQYAISVPLSKQLACHSVAERAVGYGMPGVKVDGNDPLAVYQAVNEAVERARKNQGPTLIEAVTYRLLPHSSDDDDQVYRDRNEVEEAKRRDPLLTFKRYLLSSNTLTEADFEEMEERVKREVDEATEYAENAPFAEPEDALKHVYAE